MLTLVYTVLLSIGIFLATGVVGLISGLLSPEKGLVSLEQKFRLRHPEAAKKVNQALLLLIPLFSFAIVSYLRRTHDVAPTPTSTAHVVVPEAQRHIAARHEEVASDVDDVIKATGYQAHIFAGSENDLVVVSQVLSEGQDRELLLTLLRSKWKQELCDADYATITIKAGIFSEEQKYSLFC